MTKTIYKKESEGEIKKNLELLNNIPEEIRQIPNWVIWKYEGDKKKPYQANGVWPAKVDKPSTWGSYEEAVAAYNKGGFDGIGWMLPLDGDVRYWGVDADDAIDPETGEYSEWRLANGDLAQVQPKDILAVASYSETTPSRAGFRSIFRCRVDVPDGKKKEYGYRNPKTKKIPGIEFYSTLRYFTFTGNHLAGTPTTIAERTTEALALHERVFGKPQDKTAKQPRTKNPLTATETLTDSRLDNLACDLVDGCVGSRHDLLFAICGTLVTINWERPKIESLLTILVHLFSDEDPTYDIESALATAHRNLDQCIARLKDHEAIAGWPSLARSLDQTTYDNLRATLSGDYSWNDVGNGRMLVDKHRDIIRYCVDEKCWYVWDRIRWNKNEAEISELAKGIESDIRASAEKTKLAETTGDEEIDKKAKDKYDNAVAAINRWADSSGNSTHQRAAIACASTDIRIRCKRSDFDRHHDLFNCPNGIINLITGTLMKHDRSLMLSYLCPTEYHPNARHDLFDQSLAAFTRKHPDLLPFLRTLTGYTIQGTKSDEIIIILHGPGNAGKGTVMDWLSSAFGPDYSCGMSYNSVRKQDRNAASASSDLARLEGKRLVIVSEIEKGSKLAESFMKGASGNDTIVARKQYETEREFQPTHQFWFQTNYRPGFDSLDPGNRRRYIEISFDNDLSKDPLVTFDPNIKLAMRKDKQFLEAVLAWAVAGSVDWYANGLHLPPSVKAATAALLSENDFLSEFVADECVKEPGATVPVLDMWRTYVQWCMDQGEDPARGRTFNRMLEERGFERMAVKESGKTIKGWKGIRLKKTDEKSLPDKPITERRSDGWVQ